MQRVSIIDSHTAGEPTRLVLSGAPDLGNGSLEERLQVFRDRYDWFRSAVINEPRGSEVLVGALLCEPGDPQCAAGVIFFNNVSYLGMCGHGTIGVIASLAHIGRIGVGVHQIETPVGVVSARLHEDGRVTVFNVPSYRYARDVCIEVEGHGRITGDIAWGGNWFFLVEDHGQTLDFSYIDRLTGFAWRVRQGLERHGLCGESGAPIDHVELFVPGSHGAHSRNFVLCPGNAYDRSPCGTGTSAKIACLAANGTLAPQEVWIQESIIGTRFEACYALEGSQVLPRITGAAFVTLEGSLILDERDPLRCGIGYVR